MNTRLFLCAGLLLATSQLMAQDQDGQLEVGAGYFPFSPYGAASWVPDYSLRTAYLMQPVTPIVIAWTLEYYKHRYVSNDPLSGILLTDGTRTDLAAFSAIRMFNVFEIAGGVDYSKRAAIYMHEFFTHETYLFQPYEAKFHLYYHFGLTYSFSIIQNWNLILGIQFRNQDYRDILPVTLKVGTSFSI